jgi:5'-3' exoribonuclease 1
MGIDAPPGFPTLKSLEFKSKLKLQKVNVFGSESRKESMVLYLGDKIQEDNEEGESLESQKSQELDIKFAQSLVGKSFYVEWPYLREAKVVAGDFLAIIVSFLGIYIIY